MDTTPNKYITVAYELYTDFDGKRELVEKAPIEHPFQFISDMGTTLDAFEAQIKPLQKGEKFNFTLSVEEAYGEYEQERVLELNKDVFKVNVILVLHIVILLYEYLLAGGLSHKNPFKLLFNMLPAYFTALGTSSSAATIPVTLKQTLKNGVTDGIAGFTIPLCATIHLSGSMMKITCCALTICLINGMPCNLPLFLNFIFVLAICMVAAPGVPGGAVMAALGPLASVLGFNADMQALMIALYIAMDSFGTACNVTGDGAIAIVVDKIFRKDK